MANSPCRDCPDRRVGCHAECTRYADYQICQEQTRAAKRKSRKANDPLMSPTKIRNINKARKGR